MTRIKPLNWKEWRGPKIGRYAKAITPFGFYYVFSEDEFIDAEFHPLQQSSEDSPIFRHIELPKGCTFGRALLECERDFFNLILECLE